MRDVLGANRLLREPSRKRGAEGGVTVRLQERVQPLDLGKVGECG